MKSALGALTEHQRLFLDLATAHEADEYGGANALRAQIGKQVIRVTYGYTVQGNQGISKEESPLLSRAVGLDGDQEQTRFLS